MLPVPIKAKLEQVFVSIKTPLTPRSFLTAKNEERWISRKENQPLPYRI